MTAPRPPVEPEAGQFGLDLGPEPDGPVEIAVAASIAAGRAAGEITPLHAGAAALALSLARTVDRSDRRSTYAALVAASKELRWVLGSIGLDRRSRGELDGKAAGGDPFDELTKAMSSATRHAPPPRKA